MKVGHIHDEMDQKHPLVWVITILGILLNQPVEQGLLYIPLQHQQQYTSLSSFQAPGRDVFQTKRGVRNTNNDINSG